MTKRLVGKILLDQFRVEEFITATGMSAVYRVWDLKRNVYLAMKVLHADLAEDPSVFKLFRREANALKKLAHPNIVPFYGIFQSDDLVFLLERFIDGPTLKELLHQKKGKPISVEESLVYLKALTAALGYAHAHDVVHCDVKPGNVMVDQGGNIYLTDFGIARHAESTTTTLGIAGTPAYMAPEQVRGHQVTPATDVYSLGLVLFEMLTGRRAFRGDEAGTAGDGSSVSDRIRQAHLEIPPPDPRSLNPEIPPALAQVVLKAMSKLPEQRFLNAQEMMSSAIIAAGLDPGFIQDHVEIQSQPEVPLREITPQPISEEIPTDLERSKKGLWVALGIGGAATILLVGIFGLMNNSPVQSSPIIPTETNIPRISETEIVPKTKVSPSPISSPKIQATQIPTSVPSVTSQLSNTPTSIPPTQNLPEQIIDNYGVSMVLIPDGSFQMGDEAATGFASCRELYVEGDCDYEDFTNEEPIHRVHLDNFYIDQYEVTNVKYQRCVTEGVCKAPTQGKLSHYYNNPEYANYPVVYVSWFDARRYCKWRGGRLPTEAEWEKAARGTDGRLYPWGNLFQIKRANFCDKNCSEPWAHPDFDDGFANLSPVGNFPEGVSPYGAHDLAGNVWEWLADDYIADYYSYSPSQNPIASLSGNEYVVLRGGAWNCVGSILRTGNREWEIPDGKFSNIGIRCVKSP